MCYVRKTPKQITDSGKHLHDWKDWLELGRKAREEGLFYLLLTGGEPFLYPHFRELYEGLHDMGLLLSINTNGSLLDEDTIAWLKKKAPTRVNITLYGCSEETYGRICGNPAVYPRVIKAMELLREANIPVVLNASMIPENACDLEGILDFGKKHNLNTRMATYMFPPVRREKEETDSRFTPGESAELYLRKTRYQLGDSRYLAFIKRNLDIMKEDQEKLLRLKEDRSFPREEYISCRAGRSSFWVSWEGTLTACGITSFPMKMEDIFSRNFKESWLELTELTRKSPVLRECSACEYRTLCKPCAAVLDAETGDVNHRSDYHCQMTQEIIRMMRRDWNELEMMDEDIISDSDVYENDVKYLCE